MHYNMWWICSSCFVETVRTIWKQVSTFFECLGEMAAVSDNSEFLDYTKEMISKVDRGGLFPLNDATFALFTAIEKQTCDLLPSHIL